MTRKTILLTAALFAMFIATSIVSAATIPTPVPCDYPVILPGGYLDSNSTTLNGSSGGGTSSPISPIGNLSVNSWTNFPDMGISLSTYFSNGEEHANAYLSTEVFNDGESGQYFVLEDSQFNLSSANPSNDPGLRRFTDQTTYRLVDEALATEEFEFVLVDQEYNVDECEISIRKTARNGYDYIWTDQNEDGSYNEPTQTILPDIRMSTSIYIDSPSAEFFGISYDVDKQKYSWRNEEYLVVSMNGTFHTPEPATLGLLAAGGLALLRRKRR